MKHAIQGYLTKILLEAMRMGGGRVGSCRFAGKLPGWPSRSAVGGVLGLLLPLSSLKSHPFISEGGALKIWVPGVEPDLAVFELKTSALLGKVGF